MKITLENKGQKYDCDLDDAGHIVVTPRGKVRDGEKIVFAAGVEAEYAIHKMNAPQLADGYLCEGDELADWLRINYGDEAVRVERDDKDGVVY